VEYKYGVVTRVDPEKKQVTLSSSEVLTYDVLVVAPGFVMPVILPKLGATLTERKEEVQAVGASIRAAGHVLVGGGGPVALDLAGSVRARYPEKKVTIICSKVLPQWPESDRRRVETQLEKMRIEVKTSPARCPIEAQLEACTVAGVAGDIYLPGFSQGPSTKFLEASGLLDQSGKVVVNGYLQAKSNKDVFAIGCSDIPGFTALPKLEGQWTSVAKNLGAHLKGSPLTEYKESMPGMARQPLIPLGLGANGWTFVDFSQLPLPLKICCCNGLCGFPCCPLPCCWPMTGCCLCGYCCGEPHGSGVSKFLETMQFKFGQKHFKGLGEQAAPAQEVME
jgi:NADH dehydrogenase FAD-containing subunit